MRVLMVTGKLPAEGRAGTLAPVGRQIDSLRDRIPEIEVYSITGIPILKHFTSMFSIAGRSRGFHIIHAHYGICGNTALAGSRVPVVISLMGSDILEPGAVGFPCRLRQLVENRVSMSAAGRAAAVIVKNGEMARRISPVPADVIPNGVDLCEFAPMEPALARRRLGWPESGSFVLFGGNPADRNKNFRLASQSALHAGNLLGRPVRLVPLKNIEPRMVPLYNNACDCLLFTSIREGSPNVVKEALACNRPVVSVRVGDVGALLDQTRGCHTCGYSAEELGERLASVLSEPPEADGRNTLIRNGLDSESVAERIVQVYRRVLKA